MTQALSPISADDVRFLCDHAQKILGAASSLASAFMLGALKLAVGGDLGAFFDMVLPARESLLQTQTEAMWPDGSRLAESRQFVDGITDQYAHMFQQFSRLRTRFEKADVAEQEIKKQLEAEAMQDLSPKALEFAHEIQKRATDIFTQALAQRKVEIGIDVFAKLLAQNQEQKPQLLAKCASLTQPQFTEALRIIQVASALELEPVALPMPPYVGCDALRIETATQAAVILSFLLGAYSKPPDRPEGEPFPEWATAHYVELRPLMAGVHELALRLRTRIDVERIKAERWLADHGVRGTVGETGNPRQPETPVAARDASGEPKADPGYVWMTATEAGNYIDRSSKTIRNWIRDGKMIECECEGTRYKFRLAELDAKKAAAKKPAKRTKTSH
jgi:hypothetical protein